MCVCINTFAVCKFDKIRIVLKLFFFQLCFTKSDMFQVTYVHQQTAHQLRFITSAGFRPDITSGLSGVNKLA